MAGPDIRNIHALHASIPGNDTLAPEPDTKHLDPLLDSLSGSAERFQTLWFSFLGLTLYLAITALATTYRNLLLGEPQTLPLLNIKMELLPFYVIAPLLYLVFHFYLLTMLALLARTAAEFDKQLRSTIADEADRERYRARVENALFLQLLVGMKGERTGFNALLLGLIGLITVVLAPLATLVFMQMRFLPYHHLRITWWHRGIVVADVVSIVVMTYRCIFPRGVKKAPAMLGGLSRKPRWVTAMAICVLLAVCLFPLAHWLSFQQGRWAGEPRLSFSEWRWPAFGKSDPHYAATANGVVFGLFPDRLKLPDEPVVGKETLDRTNDYIASRGGLWAPTITLDLRDMQAADLQGADLRGVSLTGAELRGAELSYVQLDNARLSCQDDPGRSESCADLQDAKAHLQGATLFHAWLRGTDLRQAQLQGANLQEAQLQGANLQKAQLQGSNLERAQLQGADLRQAQLQGADLRKAQLQVSNLSYVPGEVPTGAELQGADLRQAQLQGANLEQAQLQGANVAEADMTDAELNKTFLWRTNIGNPDPSRTIIVLVRADQVVSDRGIVRELTKSDVKDWSNAATKFAAENDKKTIEKRFERLTLDPAFQTPKQDAEDEAKFKKLTKDSFESDPEAVNHRNRLAFFLAGLACRPDHAPYVAQRLMYSRLPGLNQKHLSFVRNLMETARKSSKTEAGPERLAGWLTGSETCAGAMEFTERHWRWLEEINPHQ